MSYTYVIVFIVIIILVIITSYNFDNSLNKRPSNGFSNASGVNFAKKKVKFGNKVTRVDYDKATGDIITGRMSQKLNDS